MIVVDSAVWVDWFNDAPTPEVSRLRLARLRREAVATAPVIMTEVLSGLARPSEFEVARDILLSLRMLLLDVQGHVEAARLYLSLRSRGVTVRGVADCVIAQTCIRNEAELLTQDRDFGHMAKHSRLRLCRV